MLQMVLVQLKMQKKKDVKLDESTYGKKKVPVRNENGEVIYIKSPAITVDEINIDNSCDENGKEIKGFNENAEKILRDENNNYKYDVIYEGAYDQNNSKKLSESAAEEICKFIDSKRGFLEGHDSVANSYIDTKKGIYDRMQITPGISKKIYSGDTVKICNAGISHILSYPWHIGDEDRELRVPLTHTWHQVTQGIVALEFNNNDVIEDTINKFDEVQKPFEGHDNFYLTKNQNTSMIQTGHKQWATPDEEKILANTLFSLSQVTADTKWTCKACNDIDAPEKPEVNGIEVDADNSETLISFNKVNDKGTKYTYNVKGKEAGKKEFSYKSNDIEVSRKSGMLGYIVYCDDNKDTKISDVVGNCNKDGTKLEKVKSLGMKFINEDDFDGICKLDMLPDNKYIHVAAMDKAGNISDTSTIQYCYPKILEVSSKNNTIEVGKNLYANISLNNISNTNKSFKVHKFNDILSQKVVVKYDPEILKYVGVSQVNEFMPMTNLIDQLGSITINIAGEDEGSIEEKADLLTLKFKVLKNNESSISIDHGEFIVNNDIITLLPAQKGEFQFNKKSQIKSMSYNNGHAFLAKLIQIQ